MDRVATLAEVATSPTKWPVFVLGAGMTVLIIWDVWGYSRDGKE